jgi:hypothetical protein
MDKLAKNSKNFKEFKTNLNKYLNELWEKVKNSSAIEQQLYLEKIQFITNTIKEGREKYLPPKLKKLTTKKRLTQIEEWTLRDAEEMFLKDFYSQHNT